MKIQSFKDLTVWQQAMNLVIAVYEITKTFPSSEEFGLKSQMRRSVVSIPSNIAEGKSRSTRKDFCQFLYIAQGSISELQTQMIIANRIGYISDENMELLEEQIIGIAKMLRAFIQALQKPSI